MNHVGVLLNVVRPAVNVVVDLAANPKVREAVTTIFAETSISIRRQFGPGGQPTPAR